MNKYPLARVSLEKYLNTKPVVEYTEKNTRRIGIARAITVLSVSNEVVTEFEIILEWSVKIRTQTEAGLTVKSERLPIFETFHTDHAINIMTPRVRQEDDVLVLDCNSDERLQITHLGTEVCFAHRIHRSCEKSIRH